MEYTLKLTKEEAAKVIADAYGLDSDAVHVTRDGSAVLQSESPILRRAGQSYVAPIGKIHER